MNMLWFLFAGIFNLPDLLAGMQVYTPTEMNNDPQRVWFFDISTSRCSLRAVGQAVARQRIGVIPASYQVSLFPKGTSLSGGTLKGSTPMSSTGYLPSRSSSATCGSSSFSQICRARPIISACSEFIEIKSNTFMYTSKKT